MFEGKSTGAPIGFLVRNTNQHSKDYDNIRDIFVRHMPTIHITANMVFGDYRGGGRASARITLSRVVAGALAKLVLRQQGIRYPPTLHKWATFYLRKIIINMI